MLGHPHPLMTDRILDHVDDARRLASHTPAEALNAARKAAEALCWEFLPDDERARLAESKRPATLGPLIDLATKHGLPLEAANRLRHIQQEGNRGSHAGHTTIDIDWRDVQGVLEALDALLQWFYVERLRPSSTATGSRVSRSEDYSAPRSAMKPILGREQELSALRALVSGLAADGDTADRAVLLGGPSGVGKTALAETTLQFARDSGLQVIRTTCEAFHDGMSFYPIRECLRQVTSARGLVPDIGAAFGMTSTQVTIARLAEYPDADASARRDALVATFSNALLAREKTEGVPIVVFVDDLERIDAGSADALVCLLARMREGRILLVGAYRSDVVPVSGSSNHPLRPVIHAARRSDTPARLMDVNVLPEDQIEPLVQALLGARCELPRPFYRRLFDETDGNPLYVREALRTLSAERGDGQAAPLRLVDSSWRLVRQGEAWEIPRSIDDAIASRLVALTDLDRGVLELAAIVGRKFHFEVLLELGAASEDALIDVIERQMKADVLRELRDADGLFEFTHGKIREVLTSGMSSLRRGRLHGQVADVLLRRPQFVGAEQFELIVGTHLHAARRYAEAWPHLVRAGERELALNSTTDAAHHLRRALEAIEKDPAKSPANVDRTRLSLGVALKLSSDLIAAERELLLICNEGGDPYSRRWAWNHLGDISLLQGRVAEALERYAACEALANAEGDTELIAETAADLAELHMRQAEKLAGVDPEKSAHHATEYVKNLDIERGLAPLLENRAAKARAYRNGAKRYRTLGQIEKAIQLYELSISMSEEGVHSHQFLIPYAKALRLVDRFDEALAIVEKVLAWGRQIGAHRSEAIARQYLGLLFLEKELSNTSPNLTAAREQLVHAVALHEQIGYEQGRRETEIDLTELSAQSGDREETLRHLVRIFAEGGDAKPEAAVPENLANAMLAQLRANGETRRAARVLRALQSVGLNITSNGSTQ
jgi:predicted ATPase